MGEWEGGEERVVSHPTFSFTPSASHGIKLPMPCATRHAVRSISDRMQLLAGVRSLTITIKTTDGTDFK